MPSSGSETRQKIALDASAFYAGIPFLSGSVAEFYTTTEILSEVRHIKQSLGAIEALTDSRLLVVLEPSKGYLDKVDALSTRTGDRSRLSDADISILALALERGLVLASDDYAVSNVGISAGIKVLSSAGKGIREARNYSAYCSGCSKGFSPNLAECPQCGNRLRRKYKKSGGALGKSRPS